MKLFVVSEIQTTMFNKLSFVFIKAMRNLLTKFLLILAYTAITISEHAELDYHRHHSPD